MPLEIKAYDSWLIIFTLLTTNFTYLSCSSSSNPNWTSYDCQHQWMCCHCHSTNIKNKNSISWELVQWLSCLSKVDSWNENVVQYTFKLVEWTKFWLLSHVTFVRKFDVSTNCKDLKWVYQTHLKWNNNKSIQGKYI